MSKMIEAYTNIQIRENTNDKLNLEKFVYFWDGVFSQWYPSTFKIDNISFNTAEQYMMYKKAILFNDEETAELILQAKYPNEQKRLGRKVSNFDESVWNNHCEQIVYDGNFAKFTTNLNLLKSLLAFPTETFVEASPYDKIWGIGIDEKHAAQMPYQLWNGQNKLGLVLTILRNNIQRDIQ